MEKKEQGRQEETPIYLTGDSTLQTPSEDRRDKGNDAQRGDHMEPSNDDLHGTALTGAEERDAAGSAD